MLPSDMHMDKGGELWSKPYADSQPTTPVRVFAVGEDGLTDPERELDRERKDSADLAGAAAAVAADRDRLRAIVARLWHTKDGVPLVPDQSVRVYWRGKAYYPHWDEGTIPVCVGEHADHTRDIRIDECYSSLEAEREGEKHTGGTPVPPGE